MYKNILSPEQIALLPFIRHYAKNYVLVGGTAIALQLGHRTSVDFDLFTSARINTKTIKNYIASRRFAKLRLLMEDDNQVHFMVNEVKITFFQFPFDIPAPLTLKGIHSSVDGKIRILDLLTLAAVKAFALGGRGKWKDYVDMYFLIKYHYSVGQIASAADRLFGDTFNGKLFREQLTWFEDIDFSENVHFTKQVVKIDEVKTFLTLAAIEKL